MAKPDKWPLCNFLKPNGTRCRNPAGLGVKDGMRKGYCSAHRAVDVQMGETVVRTSEREARGLRVESEFRYEPNEDTKLGRLMKAMGAEMRMDRSRTGVPNLDLDFEFRLARAIMVLMVEDFAEREDALLKWSKGHDRGEIDTPPPEMLSYEDAHKAVLTVARLAETIQKLQEVIPKQAFAKMLTEMAKSVNKHVDSAGTRRKIQRDWMAICGEYIV